MSVQQSEMEEEEVGQQCGMDGCGDLSATLIDGTLAHLHAQPLPTYYPAHTTTATTITTAITITSIAEKHQPAALPTSPPPPPPPTDGAGKVPIWIRS